MSLPLSGCMIIKAIRGDEKMTTEIAKRLLQPAYTYHPCKCEPKCSLPDEGYEFQAGGRVVFVHVFKKL